MPDAESKHLVVVGSSAGGIDALGELVASLPIDLAAPVVVAQHLDPRRPSHLTEILERRSRLPVRTVVERQKLAPGVVYIVPADRDVSIVDGSVAVHRDSVARRPKPSVDRLFATAADRYGENLVAIVLTGAGSDGAEGARRVKLAGGTVIIQDPATARFPSMPQSLAPTTVDIVARIDAMGPLLADLVSATAPPSRDEEQALLRFLATVRDQTGIDFSQYKRATIMRRLQRRMAAVRAANLGEYIRYAARNPREFGQLASTFLIKVTEFFRDPELYDALREKILPRLVAEATARDQELRIWSAGCATGEEAYSLAILVAETLGDDLARVGVRIFATDLDNDAVVFARRGIYPASAMGGLSPELVERHFTRVGDDFEIRKNIRAMTVFGQHDLAQRAPFPRIDLAVSRNVLIYFTGELQRRALQLFAFSVREDGYLVLGKAETVTPLPEYFVVEDAKLKIYRRHGERVLIPAARGLSLTEDVAALARSRPRVEYQTSRPQRETRSTIAERSDQILLRLPVGVVLVAPDYDIQLINSAARQLLGVHSTAVGQDLVHVAREVPSQVLREGIDRARNGESSAKTIELLGAGGGAARSVEMTFVLHQVEQEGEQVDAVLIVVSDETLRSRDTRQLQGQVAALEGDAVSLQRQIESLQTANRELLKANLELTTANAELRSANEELLVGSEEVQAATEEVETLNEELQATNEELETLNEELQATIEELNTTNGDLEARGVELEETLASLQEQRRLSDLEHFRLTRMLLERDHGLLVVDDRGNVVARNETWRRAVDEDHATSYQREPDGRAVRLVDLVAEMMPAATRGEAFEVALRGTGPRGGARRKMLKAEALRDERGRLRGTLLTLSPYRTR